MGIEKVNILQAYLNDDYYLTILDELTGFQILQVGNNETLTHIMNMYLPRAIAFDQHEDTYLVVAETVNNIEYILEIFVNFEKKEYFYNKVYFEDFAVRDIEVRPGYAIIIGEDQHYVL